MNALELSKTNGIAKQTGQTFSCNLADIWTVQEAAIVILEIYIGTNVTNAALKPTPVDFEEVHK